MGNSALKSVVVLFFIIALAFITGSYAAEDVKAAVIPMSIIVGLFVIMYLGQKSWALIYVAPSLFAFLGVAVKLPIGHVVATVVLVYWCAMSFIGRYRLTWNSAPVLDIPVFLLFANFLVLYIRHPATIMPFIDMRTVEGEVMIQGAAYIWGLFAFISYITISVIPYSLDSMLKVIKWSVIIGIVLSLLSLPKAVIQLQTLTDSIYEAPSHSLSGIAFTLMTILLCKYHLLRILFSPWKLAVLLFSAFGLAISGARVNMMCAAVILFVTQIIHKRFWSMLVILLMAYACLFILSHGNYLRTMPFGVQRVLTAVPGLSKHDSSIAGGAKHSIDWRVEMWEMAMNPSTGYIKDYVWGDGVGTSTKYLRNLDYRRAYGLALDYSLIAESRAGWHSGPITFISHSGYVGFALVLILIGAVVIAACRVIKASYNISNREYIWYYIVLLFSSMARLIFADGGYHVVFEFLSTISLLKVLYSLLIKEGYMRPLFERRTYTPMLIRESKLSNVNS